MRRTQIYHPTATGEIVALLIAIKRHHEELGAESPLRAFDWATVGPQIDECAQLQKEIDRREAEIAPMNERRTALLMPLRPTLRNLRSILAAFHAEELYKLHEYGFSLLSRAENHAVSTEEEPPTAAPHA